MIVALKYKMYATYTSAGNNFLKGRCYTSQYQKKPYIYGFFGTEKYRCFYQKLLNRLGYCV